MKIYSVEKPDLPPWEMPDRFRTQIVYFMTLPGTDEVPQLPPGDYWIRLEDSRRWLDELVVQVVSPLDAEVKAEIELSDEQEAWLQWLVDHQIQHLRTV
ncbi:MAG: hypothetical protein EA424_21670 [Planctomycetaceae bacterium]|nr:MAG: hypothetical protein EA424_21670 [Planctomycetaceae bacterium]